MATLKDYKLFRIYCDKNFEEHHRLVLWICLCVSVEIKLPINECEQKINLFKLHCSGRDKKVEIFVLSEHKKGPYLNPILKEVGSKNNDYDRYSQRVFGEKII